MSEQISSIEDFGTCLRERRQEAGLSLQQISSVTKISVSTLEALENNDISGLPGGIFSRAVVRCYASEVGFDPEDTLHVFLEKFPSEAGISKSVKKYQNIETIFENWREYHALILRWFFLGIVMVSVIVYFILLN